MYDLGKLNCFMANDVGTVATVMQQLTIELGNTKDVVLLSPHTIDNEPFNISNSYDLFFKHLGNSSIVKEQLNDSVGAFKHYAVDKLIAEPNDNIVLIVEELEYGLSANEVFSFVEKLCLLSQKGTTVIIGLSNGYLAVKSLAYFNHSIPVTRFQLNDKKDWVKTETEDNHVVDEAIKLYKMKLDLVLD